MTDKKKKTIYKDCILLDMFAKLCEELEEERFDFTKEPEIKKKLREDIKEDYLLSRKEKPLDRN